ncbi:hypothetical protein [Clostridium sp. E02]|uniref:hypothetical protein n=1 Tax=Clostridium sp. E02 TaxID=2487134 RepID=UPI000F521F56|nr:hypothetical protein [Clostridium sp. E02]
MPRVKNRLLRTKREMDVMSTLRNNKNTLAASQIAKKDESLGNNKVQSVLRKLMDKEYINPFQKSGDGIPIPSLVGTLLKHEKKDKEKIEKLEKILKERKKKLSQKDN